MTSSLTFDDQHTDVDTTETPRLALIGYYSTTGILMRPIKHDRGKNWYSAEGSGGLRFNILSELNS